MSDVQGKRVLVVGLARTGLAAAKCLAKRGAAVTVTDSRPPWELRADTRELLVQKIGLELGLHRQETFLNQDLIIVSPGVLPDLPQLLAARQKNIPIVSEVEAASWFLESPIIGITGSNGKTTTTSLLGEILEASAFPTFVGGNIGVPLISAVDDVPSDAFVVTELSSFQLEAIHSFRPRVAVMLNISPNHLDRHPSLEAYVQAKSQIFKNQTGADFAILNADDPMVMALATSSAARKILFSRRRELPEGVFVADGHIYYRVGNLERVLLSTRDIPLRGDFNVENVLAASATACVLGANFEAIRRAVRAFRGVEHRLEFVREIRGVHFYNDSKATSVDATAKALSAFNHGVHLILGGKGKGAPYAPIRALLGGRVRAAYLIGAAAERIEQELRGAVDLVHSGDLATAVRDAFSHAVSGDVVLLSPACASFDQFQDFEHRGRVFKGVVARLAQESERQGFGRLADESVPNEKGGDLPPPFGKPETSVAAEDIRKVIPRSGSHGVDSRAVGPEPQVSVPERIYFYEIAAEEIEYLEPDVAMDYAAKDLERVDLGPIPAPEDFDDEALPFEVRRKAEEVRPAKTKTGGEARPEGGASGRSGDGAKLKLSAGQSRLPGL